VKPEAETVMPPRWLAVFIALFWLTTSAAFFWREYWPYLEPGAPPPFAIDLVDEARNAVPVRWDVLHNDRVIMVATTNIDHDAKEECFILRAEFKPVGKREAVPRTFGLALQHMTSSYHVNPEGKLLGLEATAEGNYLPPFSLGKPPGPIEGMAKLQGVVKNGRFTGDYAVTVEGVPVKSESFSVSVSSQGSVLVPLHPVNHIRGLRPGQTWRVPVADPIADLFAALTGIHDDPIDLQATVLAEPRSLEWNNQSCECLVIEYTGEDIIARTWVWRNDDLVLRQEFTKSGDTMILQRIK
jgi:hypothetical protein